MDGVRWDKADAILVTLMEVRCDPDECETRECVRWDVGDKSKSR